MEGRPYSHFFYCNYEYVYGEYFSNLFNKTHFSVFWPSLSSTHSQTRQHKRAVVRRTSGLWPVVPEHSMTSAEKHRQHH